MTSDAHDPGCSDPSGTDCGKVLRELQVYLDAECGPSLDEVIARHLGHCHPCLRRADFEQALRALVATRCRESAPASLQARIMGAIRGAP